MEYAALDENRLKSVASLPRPFQSVFNFRYFNSLQSECFPGTFHSDMNMVISAPTGSGKTVLFELCILRLLSRYLSEDGKLNFHSGSLKTIYIAPSKALVQEKLRYWRQRLGQSLGVKCLELTGDSEGYSARDMQETDIILTTPEKFDSLTRCRIKNGGLSFFGDIALLLIDEVHLLSETRGAALEAIISRIKMLSCRTELLSCPLANIRFVAVSATIPNIEDIAEWLMVPNQGIKKFGEEMRPVRLTTKVFGYAPAKNDFLFERRLQNFLYDIIMQHSKGKASLVFCSTRKGAQETALYLSQTLSKLAFPNPFIRSADQQERLHAASFTCSEKQMQTCIQHGVGYHNGGLCLGDRNLVEGLFLKGDLQVLCTTNTLAHGINLPAHTVIVKSTQYYNKEKGRYIEYDRSTILQMCGRAGRPQFDASGLVIIMTRKETLHLYENLLSGCEMVESQLLSSITEHLNAEIVQLSVSDISLAIQWLKYSFLYVRVRQNPEHYGLNKSITCEQLEKRLKEICVQNINELADNGMISIDEYGFGVKPLEPGRLMAKYYLRFNTMKGIMKTPQKCSIENLLHIISKSEEISWIQLRRSEKKLLNDVNSDKNGRLRFHVLDNNGKVKKRIQTREEKIFVLANDCLSGDPVIHDLTLTQDTNGICSNGARISRCMRECFIFQKRFNEAISSMILAKCLHQRLWDDSPFQLRQLSGVGMVTAKALHLSGISSFEDLENTDPRRLEIITGRKYPFGNHIKESLFPLPPKIHLKIEEAESKNKGHIKLVITLTRLGSTNLAGKKHFADLIVGSQEDNLILFNERIRLDEFPSPYTITVCTARNQNASTTLKAAVISEVYVGLDLHEKFIYHKPETAKQQQKHTAAEVVKPAVVKTPRTRNQKRKEERLKLEVSNSRYTSCNTDNSVDCTRPTFELLPEDSYEDKTVVEENSDSTYAITNTQEENDNTEKIVGDSIFEHIRKKARSLPTFGTCASFSSCDVPEVSLFPKQVQENEISDFDPSLPAQKAEKAEVESPSGSGTQEFRNQFLKRLHKTILKESDFVSIVSDISSVTADPPKLGSEIDNAAEKNASVDSNSTLSTDDFKSDGAVFTDCEVNFKEEAHHPQNSEGDSTIPDIKQFQCVWSSGNTGVTVNLEPEAERTTDNVKDVSGKHSRFRRREHLSFYPDGECSISSNPENTKNWDAGRMLSLNRERLGPSFMGCGSLFSFL